MIHAVAIVDDDGFRIHKNFDPAYRDRSIPVILEYLAEGGANVILRLVAFAGASKFQTAPEGLINKILRLRKDKDFTITARDQYACYTNIINPLFDTEHLVVPFLVSVDAAFLVDVNRELRDLEQNGYRPKMREGDLVAETEDHGFLMTDMSPVGAEISIEIKPKWLTQSPNAPEKARRCRTCALRAQKVRQGKLDARKASEQGFCPLALLADNEVARTLAAKKILAANKCDWFHDGEHVVSKILATDVRPLLQQLRKYQTQYDATGILAVADGEEPPPDYLLAMTLRDCTLFIRAPQSLRSDPVEVRLADLDAKRAHPHKVIKWRENERSLTDEGWYTNEEEHATKESDCLLSMDLTT